MSPDPLPQLPPRPAESHKGTFGHVLVVAGSRGMAGAAVLCGSAALRGGAGTVQVAVPDVIQATVAAAQPCYTTAGLASGPTGQFAAHALIKLRPLTERADVIALGPGLGGGAAIRWLVRGLLETASRPIVLDADGLNALVPLNPGERVRAQGQTVLTPHPGEFARLLGVTTAQVQADRERFVKRWAAERGVVLILKGMTSLVSDGRRLYVNRTGNPGMATGGSGDVLTGLIAALIGQGLSAWDAARLGVHRHGLAGDLAREELGEISLTAADLLAFLPRAFRDSGPT